MKPRQATSLRTVVRSGAAVVEAQGELDRASVGQFRAALDEAVASGLPLVVVDLGQVAFLDSAGLSVIFGAQRTMPPSQRLVLGNVPEKMLRTLRLAAVGAVVEFYPAGTAQPWQEAAGPLS